MKGAPHQQPASWLRPQGPPPGRPPDRPPAGTRPGLASTPLEHVGLFALLAVVVAGTLVAVSTQLSTRLVSGTWLRLDAAEWGRVLIALPQHPLEPAVAFPDEAAAFVAGPWAFWGTLAAVILVPLAGTMVVARRWAGRRHRAGPRAATWARRRDTKALHVPAPTPGRLTLGHADRHLVAAEAGQSVAVLGPTRSGKTTGLAVPAILEWDGPIIATSVKTDLVRDTISWRRRQGQVWVFDPTSTTGLPGATWSPLGACDTWQGARRVASWMAATVRDAGGAGGLTDGDFWYASAAKLLGPLLFAAAIDGLIMADVVRWVDTHEEVKVLAALDRAGVDEAFAAAQASFSREVKQKSSVYTTVETVLAAYADPAVSASARSCEITPERLLDGGAHTLYLCAPYDEQKRLRPVFTALVQTMLATVYQRAHTTGQPLKPSLLLALDEAANIAPLDELDTVASTAAGQGVQLVTVWQDLNQMRARYGDRAYTILNNHRATMVLPGIKDPATLDHISRLVGETEVTRPSTTWDAHGQRSTTEGIEHRRLAPDHTLRTLADGEALVVYGSLPPLRLRLRPWFTDSRLTQRSHSGDERLLPTPTPTWAAVDEPAASA